MRMFGYDHIAFLYASEQRRRVFLCLVNSPSRPGKLSKRAATSRKTVHQALNGFIDHGWVATESGCGSGQNRSERQWSRYVLTVSGDLIAQLIRSGNPLKSDSDDAVAYLAGSDHRPQLLNLLKNRPQRVSRIIATEDVARTESRLYQTMNELADHGWVRQLEGDSSYTLTVAGRNILERFEALAETIGWITKHTSALNQLGNIGGTIPVRELVRDRVQTTVIEAKTGNPDTVLNYYSRQLAVHKPSYLRVITPVVTSLSTRIHRPLIENGHTRIEIVVDEAVVDAARSSYSDMLEAAAVTEGFDIYVYPERLGFGLAILDKGRRTLISGHDGMGIAQTCIDSPTKSFGEWAIELFDTYRESAIPFEIL